MSEGGFVILVGTLILLSLMIIRLKKYVHYIPPNSELGAEGHFSTDVKDSHSDIDLFDDGDDGGGDGD